jgi:hypothetical protein
MLLNLDSEEDGVIFVGCAGGEDTLIDLKPSFRRRLSEARRSDCR